jgi:hypothetical protein
VLGRLECRGGAKIDTSFHADGQLKSCFPRKDVMLDGVTCNASLFSPVYLHPNGRLHRCTLAHAATVAGRQLPRGAKLNLDVEGRLREPQLTAKPSR